MPKAKRTNAAPRTNPHRMARPLRGQRTLPEVEDRYALRNAVAFGQNTTGLPSLPLELHLELLSYMDCQPIPCINPREPGATERFTVVYALSRTCKALYLVYNPQFWKIVEARGWRLRSTFCSDRTPTKAQDLLSYARVLTRQGPHLASLVQVFNVELTTDDSKTVYRELAHCLPHLPNLHTFQVMGFPPGRNDRTLDVNCLQHFEEAFARIAPLVRVHTLTLPPILVARLEMKRIFPSLRHMCFNQLGTPDKPQIPRELKLVPKGIEALTLRRHSVKFVETDINYLAALFRDLRVTPRLYLTDKKGDWHKALQSVFDGWRKVHTIHIVNHGGVNGVSCLCKDEKFIEEATEGIQRSLALQENQDVVAGGIKIWHRDWQQAKPQRVISVRRREKDRVSIWNR